MRLSKHLTQICSVNFLFCVQFDFFSHYQLYLSMHFFPVQYRSMLIMTAHLKPMLPKFCVYLITNRLPFQLQLIGISVPGLEPEFQPVANYLLPYIISHKQDAVDMHLQVN